MAEVRVNRIINAPLEKVWDSFDDFGSIFRFNPNLKGSNLLAGSPATGPGAKRRCDFADGKNHVLEEIISYRPKEQMVVTIYDGTVPLKSAVITLDLDQLGPNRTQISILFRFEAKMGLIGKLLQPLMKSQFSKALNRLLEGNAAYLEKGEIVGRAA